MTSLVKENGFENKILKFVKTNIVLTANSSPILPTFAAGKDLYWDSISNKDCIETYCKKCSLKSSFHPNYVNVNIFGCVGISCENWKMLLKDY